MGASAAGEEKGASEPSRELTPFRGPPAAKEWFESLRAAGLTLLTHHADFIHRAGVSEVGGVSQEHESLMDLLRHAVTWDQLDGCRCAASRVWFDVSSPSSSQLAGIRRRRIGMDLSMSRQVA